MIGAERWEDWPQGAYSHERAREIRELVEAAEDLLAADDPEVIITAEPPELDGALVERMEEVRAEIEGEIDELEATEKGRRGQRQAGQGPPPPLRRGRPRIA